MRKIKPREVKSARVGKCETGKATVYPGVPKDTVVVSWICGTARTFKTDDLEKAIEYVDRVLLKGPDSWMSLKFLTSGGQESYVRFRDGRLQADTSPNPDSTAAWVSWFNLRKACQATLKDLAKARDKKGSKVRP